MSVAPETEDGEIGIAFIRNRSVLVVHDWPVRTGLSGRPGFIHTTIYMNMSLSDVKMGK